MLEALLAYTAIGIVVWVFLRLRPPPQKASPYIKNRSIPDYEQVKGAIAQGDGSIIHGIGIHYPDGTTLDFRDPQVRTKSWGGYV